MQVDLAPVDTVLVAADEAALFQRIDHRGGGGLLDPSTARQLKRCQASGLGEEPQNDPLRVSYSVTRKAGMEIAAESPVGLTQVKAKPRSGRNGRRPRPGGNPFFRRHRQKPLIGRALAAALNCPIGA